MVRVVLQVWAVPQHVFGISITLPTARAVVLHSWVRSMPSQRGPVTTGEHYLKCLSRLGRSCAPAGEEPKCGIVGSRFQSPSSKVL